MIDDIIIRKFKKLTNYPIDKFLQDSKNFYSNDFPNIVSFYKGESNFIDKKHIKQMNYLSEQSIIITNLFYVNKGKMSTIDYWNLLITIENLKSKYETSQNISKYLRSSILQGKNKAGHIVEHVMNQEETLEKISDKEIGERDSNNRWVDIALENDLKEVDWDIDGGKKLKLRKKIFQSNIVTSMIDNTIGEKIYGKDIKRLLTLKDNDLLSLGYKESVFQAVDILSTLSKEDIPEFRYLGINADLYKGVNFSQLNYPSITRELKRNFQTDDLFKDFEIKKLGYDNGDLHIEFQIGTKYDLVILKNISL